MIKSQYSILEEKNVIDDHLLDIIGNEFKFDHEKGIAEWLKNSVDAYIRSNLSDHEQTIILRFLDGTSNNASFECVDFNGMTANDIDKALKRWGDPEAAKRGLKKKVYGGHGNGGKFYMRQMFESSHFVSYKDGLLNVFGFNINKKYGFASGFKNKKVNYKDALTIAGLSDKIIPTFFLEKIMNGESGFTVVKGVAPLGMKNKIKVIKICEKLKKHPQSMRIMERINVKVIHNGDLVYENLKPEKIKSLVGFETPIILEIPEKIIGKDREGEEKMIILSNKKFNSGRLILKTSELALSNSKYSELNRIDIIGELGVIASYNLRELGLYYPQTDYIYGECECAILEDPEDDCVMNDRTKLADNEKTRALLQWITQQTKDLCEKIAKREQKESEEIKKKMSSDFNNFLDKWKNRFMSKILSEVLVGSGEGDQGNTNEGGVFIGTGKGAGESGNNKKTGGNEGDGEGEQKKKSSRFPKVLLSGYDDDPLTPGAQVFLQPTQGLVYQRSQDVKEGIYWINTSSPLAKAILDRYDSNSPRWRDYLFQRYVDIFVKEALIRLEKKEPERFTAVTIDGEILGKVVQRIHEVASQDLQSFLFEENYEVISDDSAK
jgi:hypothetical protein